MVKKLLLCMSVATLAGCAAGRPSVRLSDLQTDIHVRDQRHLKMDFPKIQMALFEHQRVCGSAPTFAVDSNDPSRATITLKMRPGAGWGHTVLVDLTFLSDLTVKATTYSYYAGVDKQVAQIFAAIAHPKVCPKP